MLLFLCSYLHFTFKRRYHSCIYVSQQRYSSYFCFYFLCFKYLSIGKDPGVLPITYNHLKIIELYQVSFEDMKEILVVLRLITNSPNLKELQLSVSYCEYVILRFYISLLIVILVFSFTLQLIVKITAKHRDPL